MNGKGIENAVQESGAKENGFELTGAGIAEGITEIFGKVKEWVTELKYISSEIENIERKITELKQQLKELEDERHKLVMQRREYNIVIRSAIERIQNELGIPLFGIMPKSERKTEKTEKTENKRFGFKVKVKTTELGTKAGLQEVEGVFDSLKEAYYSLYPERRGRSYKFRELIEKLAEKGLIELTYL